MQRKLFFLLLITALVPALMFASGKIRGKVTDAGTGEPLVGANVVVVGSSMGAATNTSGEYTILNVPAGTYTLKTSYVGYQAITLSNIRVNNDLTSDANFQLPAEGVTVATVEITAERPMVNKSATNAVRIIDNEFFAKIPARGVGTAIAIQPGVVSQGGNYYIRGGRPDEVGFRVEGVGVNNVLFGGQAVNVTAEAIEQIQVQAGGFNAEYGGANAGIVSSQLRNGGAEGWKASILAETDRFTPQGKKALSTFSYGYSDLTATFGGPLLSRKLRLFGSVQNTFFRDPTVRVADGFSYTGANALVTDPTRGVFHTTTSKRDTLDVVVQDGNWVGGQNNRWTFSGSLLLDLGEIQVRGAGSYSYSSSRNTTQFANLFNQARLGLNKGRDGFGNLKISHVLNPTTFYEVNFNYFNNTAESMDPDFEYDLFSYGDSLANAAKGYILQGNSVNWNSWSLFNGAFNLNQPGTQINGFAKTKMRSWGGRADFTTQLKTHEIKVGGEYTRYTVRRYAPSGVFGWAQLARDNPNPDVLKPLLKKVGGTGSDIYGYDIYGNEVDDETIVNGAIYDMAPRHPVFAAAYVQDKIELSDVILNLGLRYDYITPDSYEAPKPGDIRFNTDDLILASSLSKTPKTEQISPRIGFSFPVTDRTVFHAQYGKFIQQTQLRDSYLGLSNVAGIVKGGFFTTTPVGWGLKPTRTTQYEMGFAQQISDAASFDITAFYKDITDQITFTYILPDAGAEVGNYASLVNGDFSSAKGLEMKLTLRRTNRVSAMVNYTFSDARSTASNPASVAGLWSAGAVVVYPKYVFPVDFNQAHRGSVLLDYRFAKNDGGPILEQLGLNVLLQFNSGHSFTRVRADVRTIGDIRNRFPIEEIGASTTPWYFQLDARLDKTVKIGPLDANFYIYVINLLGTDNAVNVFPRTGDPKDDGWFSTAGGKADAANLGPQFVSLYNDLNLGRNSGNFGPPRQFRFGVKLEY